MPEGRPVMSSAASANEPSSLLKPPGAGVTCPQNHLQGPLPRPGSCEVLSGTQMPCTEPGRASAYPGEPAAEAGPVSWSPAHPLAAISVGPQGLDAAHRSPGPSHGLTADFSGQQGLNRKNHMWLLVPVLGSISLEHSSPALSGRTSGKA